MPREPARLEHAGAGDAHRQSGRRDSRCGRAPWRRCQSRRTRRASSTAATSAAKEPASNPSLIRSSVALAAGDGSCIWAKAAPRQAGSAASAATWRPASIAPSNDSTGTSTATTSAASRQRAYHGRTRSQKCRPNIACVQATTRQPAAAAPAHGERDKIDPQSKRVIARSVPKKLSAIARADDVPGEQDRDRETEHELQISSPACRRKLRRCHKRPQRQRVMHQESAVERRLHRRVATRPGRRSGQRPGHRRRPRPVRAHG